MSATLRPITGHREIWHRDALLARWRISPLPAVKNSTVQQTKMVHGRRLNYRKIWICR